MWRSNLWMTFLKWSYRANERLSEQFHPPKLELQANANFFFFWKTMFLLSFNENHAHSSFFDGSRGLSFTIETENCMRVWATPLEFTFIKNKFIIISGERGWSHSIFGIGWVEILKGKCFPSHDGIHGGDAKDIGISNVFMLPFPSDGKIYVIIVVNKTKLLRLLR